MNLQPREIRFQLPAWLDEHVRAYAPTTDAQAQMRLVVATARHNVLQATGGPFAAAVFAADSGALVALGVNLVITQGLSFLHAEMVALALAQRRLDTYDLGRAGLPPHRLVSSVEPCSMCLGAIPWSGIREVITGASDADARAIGFDEGYKPDDWQGMLEQRGIRVSSGILREEARAVLQLYRQRGGHIYSSRET